jgi:hypothetical protein
MTCVTVGDRLDALERRVADELDRRAEQQAESREIWLAAWLAVASSSNTNNGDVPAKWADRCLKDYRERFPS